MSVICSDPPIGLTEDIQAAGKQLERFSGRAKTSVVGTTLSEEQMSGYDPDNTGKVDTIDKDDANIVDHMKHAIGRRL